VGWPGRPHPRRRGWNPDGAAAGLDRRVDLGERALRIVQGDNAHPDQPLVVGAELRDPPVQGPGAAVLHIQVLRRHELRAGEGGEHQLSRKAQIIQGLGPFGRVHGAIGRPALGALHDIDRDLGGGGGVLLPGERALDGLGRAGAAGLQAHADQTLANLRIRIGREPVQALHDVAVRVVDDAALRIGHFSNLPYVLPDFAPDIAGRQAPL
jgi:hypothetical protein